MRNEHLHLQGAGALGSAGSRGEGLTPSSALQGTEETPKLTWESTAPPPAWLRQGIAPFGCLMSALSENFAGTLFREEGIGFMASSM